MTEPLQLTVDGREERPTAPVAALTFEAPPLFNAPQTIRGQIPLVWAWPCGHPVTPEHPFRCPCDSGEDRP
jgi:hypothetical protein